MVLWTMHDLALGAAAVFFFASLGELAVPPDKQTLRQCIFRLGSSHETWRPPPPVSAMMRALSGLARPVSG